MEPYRGFADDEDTCEAAFCKDLDQTLRTLQKLLFDDVPLEAGNKVDHFSSFPLRHLEFIQRGLQMSHSDLPIAFADAESRMDGLHVTTQVGARSTRRLTQKFHEQLVETSQRIGALALKKDAKLRVVSNPTFESGDDCVQGVISAEPLIERLLLRQDGGPRSTA